VDTRTLKVTDLCYAQSYRLQTLQICSLTEELKNKFVEFIDDNFEHTANASNNIKQHIQHDLIKFCVVYRVFLMKE